MTLTLRRLACLLVLLAACASRDEAANRERLARAQARADSAAPVVDTIVVDPESLVLAVGDSLRGSISHFEARDASGKVLSGFVPLIKIANDSIAAFVMHTLVAKRVGTTSIAVVPMTFGDRVRAAPETTRVHLRVVPATH